MGPVMSMVTCSVTSVTTTASSVFLPLHFSFLCTVQLWNYVQYFWWFTAIALFIRYLLPPPTSLGPSLPKLTVNQILRSASTQKGTSWPDVVYFLEQLFQDFELVDGADLDLESPWYFWPSILLRFPRPFLFMWCDSLVKIPSSNSNLFKLNCFVGPSNYLVNYFEIGVPLFLFTFCFVRFFCPSLSLPTL